MLFVYEAANKKEENIIRGEIVAESKQAAIEYLERKNLIPIKIEVKGNIESPVMSTPSSILFFERVSPTDRIALVRNLAAVIKAGLGIIEALDILIGDTTKRVMRNILIQAKTWKTVSRYPRPSRLLKNTFPFFLSAWLKPVKLPAVWVTL